MEAEEAREEERLKEGVIRTSPQAALLLNRRGAQAEVLLGALLNRRG